MGLLTSLFSWLNTSKNNASDASFSAEIEHKGFIIIATPAAEGSQFRINGLIRLSEAEEVREHVFIRADLLPTPELCSQETFRKAKLMIDQQGHNIFN